MHKKTAFKMSRKTLAKVSKKFTTAIKAKSKSAHAVNTVKKQKTAYSSVYLIYLFH